MSPSFFLQTLADRVQFVGQADAKINHFVEDLRDGDLRVEEICGPGADLQFDQLISALGHIARQKPKHLIDTLMYWRKSKSEAAMNAKTDLHHVRSIRMISCALLIFTRPDPCTQLLVLRLGKTLNLLNYRQWITCKARMIQPTQPRLRFN